METETDIDAEKGKDFSLVTCHSQMNGTGHRRTGHSFSSRVRIMFRLVLAELVLERGCINCKVFFKESTQNKAKDHDYHLPFAVCDHLKLKVKRK